MTPTIELLCIRSVLLHKLGHPESHGAQEKENNGIHLFCDDSYRTILLLLMHDLGIDCFGIHSIPLCLKMNGVKEVASSASAEPDASICIPLSLDCFNPTELLNSHDFAPCNL